MPLRSIGTRKAALIGLLLICSLLASFALVLAHGHSMERAHSCGVCHLSHLTWVAPQLAASIAPTILEQWLPASQRSQFSHDPRVRFSSPRAPPL